jgi:DNA polymerase-3 subunit epsilon
LRNRVIIFDFETNGLRKSSVLSAGAVVCTISQGKLCIEKLIDRYYYPKESFNTNAAAVHGITPEIIASRRVEDYPKHFCDDPWVKEFFSQPALFVAHNISFDSSFLPVKLKHKFCTMRANVDELKIPKGNGYKYPKLIETANHYRIRLTNAKLHSAIYDCQVTLLVFAEMLKRKNKLLMEAWRQYSGH